MLSKLDKQHHPRNWAGVYSEVLPYLQAAFAEALEELKLNIHDDLVRDEAILLVKELCNPDLSVRGHPKGIGKHDQYSLQRYVTRLDLLTKRLEVSLRARKKSA